MAVAVAGIAANTEAGEAVGTAEGRRQQAAVALAGAGRMLGPHLAAASVALSAEKKTLMKPTR